MTTQRNTINLPTYKEFVAGASNEIQWPKFQYPALPHLLLPTEVFFKCDACSWLLNATPEEDRTFMLAVVTDIVGQMRLRVMASIDPAHTKAAIGRLEAIMDRLHFAIVMHHAPPMHHPDARWMQVRYFGMTGRIVHHLDGSTLVSDLVYDFEDGTYVINPDCSYTQASTLEDTLTERAEEIDGQIKYLQQKAANLKLAAWRAKQ